MRTPLRLISVLGLLFFLEGSRWVVVDKQKQIIREELEACAGVPTADMKSRISSAFHA